MSWHYAVDGQVVGPIADDGFEVLVRSGAIRPETLVWRPGMPEWKPFREVVGPAGPPAGGLPSPATPPPAGEAACANCGASFPRDRLIDLGGLLVCATCRPYMSPSLTQGSPPATGIRQLRYAGFWIRWVAKLIDGLILAVPIFAIMVPFFIVEGLPAERRHGRNPDLEAAGVELLVQALSFVLSAAYTIFFNGRFGATPGKMAVGIRVVRAGGEKISYGLACGRFFAEILSAMICYIGYIIAGFDLEEKRSLHDHICNTRVIFK